ncbi:MAG: type VI secretion system tip protein VgrG [Desulfobacterota bacterium]|nr:type VI secretion system tip protein VgrG [Thermodesulfobacteriota bacterium]
MAPKQAAHEAKFLFEVLGTSYETRVLEFTLTESLSSPFELDLSLASEDEIKFEEVVGKEALLTLLGEEKDRYCHGIINRFSFRGSKGRFYLYQARVVPKLWLLSLERDCRIFQDKDVEEIVKQVLQEGGIPSDRFNFRLQNKPPKREYCVQYRETDLNFISRLLEEEGIFYYFEHSKDKHVLHFRDSSVAYQDIQGTSQITYNPASKGMVPEEDYVFGFDYSKRIHSGKMTQRDFNFEKPSLDLKSEEKHKEYDKLEIYDYPGRYLDQERGKRLTKIRLEESMATGVRVEGQSSCVRFLPGFKFKLKDHEWESFNQEYLLVEVVHRGTQPQSLEEQAVEGPGTTYWNTFIGIPASVTFRPERKTPKALVEGMQTAWVTGPKGEEIYTDEYGRVKVQFHWDREGKRDEKTTCWLRVAQFWAGKGWGTVFLPRVGDEVLVDFLEGDPDRPIVVGSFYNEEAKPLYKLPDEKTKSTIKTKSYPNDPGFNEIRFEDKKGEEEIFIHAEKDMNEVVENNRTISVGGTHTETIQGNTKITIQKGTFEHDVKANTARYHVQGNLTEEYDANQTTTVGGDITISSRRSFFHLTAHTEILLTVGASTLLLKSDGTIALSGKKISIVGDSEIKTSAPKIETSGGQEVKIGVGNSVTKFDPASVTTSGARINTSATGIHEIKGGIVKIN